MPAGFSEQFPVRRMRKRGIRVLPGGDYGFPTSPHGAYAKDLAIFVDILGFSPMETLVAATKHGGEIMGMPDRAAVESPENTPLPPGIQ